MWAKGYWVRTSVAVNLGKDDKKAIGNPSMPRPEIDVLAYDAARNHLLAIECKSYLDSNGVTLAELCGAKESKTYKLFRRPELREMVLTRLADQCIATGLCRVGATVQLGLIAGKVYRQDEEGLDALFKERDWFFRGPSWVKKELGRQAESGYANQVSTVVAKLLLRP